MTNKNKDWLAAKIIESKVLAPEENREREERLYSMFGAWNNDEEMDGFEAAIRERRATGVTRKIVSHCSELVSHCRADRRLKWPSSLRQ